MAKAAPAGVAKLVHRMRLQPVWPSKKDLASPSITSFARSEEGDVNRRAETAAGCVEHALCLGPCSTLGLEMERQDVVDAKVSTFERPNERPYTEGSRRQPAVRGFQAQAIEIGSSDSILNKASVFNAREDVLILILSAQGHGEVQEPAGFQRPGSSRNDSRCDRSWRMLDEMTENDDVEWCFWELGHVDGIPNSGDEVEAALGGILQHRLAIEARRIQLERGYGGGYCTKAAS
jgi:hypothetical protein